MSWVADKIIETEPRRARKPDEDGNASLVLKETTVAFAESQILVFVDKVMHCETQTLVFCCLELAKSWVLEIEHCESQTLVFVGKSMHCESQGLGFAV